MPAYNLSNKNDKTTTSKVQRPQKLKKSLPLICRYAVKVIIEKSRGEGSLMEQDTIENVSKLIKKKNVFF